MLIELRTTTFHRWIGLIVFVAVGLLFIPQPAVRASVLPKQMKQDLDRVTTQVTTNQEATDQRQRKEDMEIIRRELEREAVKKKLGMIGFTPDEIEQRLKRLSDRQIHTMAKRIEYVRTGGHNPDWTPPDHPILLILFIILLPIIAVIWILVWLFHSHSHGHGHKMKPATNQG